jgi:transcription antitermination factor NusG
MQFKVPKNTEKYEWTKHAAYKMKQYGLTAQRILRVVKNPQRVEEGIVKNTIAVMQPASLRTKEGKRVWSQEIWAMYQIKCKVQNAKLKTISNQKVRIISAWRYPGVSPKRDPIPEDILRELESML